MQLTAYEIALISGGFGIAGTMAGAWLNYHLSIIRSQFDARRLAGMRLREAFATELAILQRSTERDFNISHFLQYAFIKHQIAINEFRLFLTDKELTAFSRIWQEYYGYPKVQEFDDILEGVFFEKYAKTTDPNGREKAIKNIEYLLTFTEPPKFKWYHYLFQK